MDVTRPTPPALCRIDDIPDGGALEAVLPGPEADSLVLLRQGEAVHAFHNVCPHAGRPLNWAPGRFLLEKGLLICAAHGASFEFDGRCVAGPCRGDRLRALSVHCADGQVWMADDCAQSL